MNNCIKIIKRYKFFLFSLVLLIIISSINKSVGYKSILSAYDSLIQMISVLPPIMILLGLIDVWVPREKLIKYMGNNSGLIGIFLSMLIASIAAGPMYAAFPFAAILIKKGVKFSNIIIFLNAWCVTKFSTLLFEVGALGYRFTLYRLIINIPGVILMGYIVNYFMDKKSLTTIYEKASK